MTNYTNLTGTSNASFQISLSGPVIYQGTADPTVTPPAGTLKQGDLYFRYGAANQIWSYNGAVWSDITSTFTGGSIAGPLDVTGQITTGDEFLVLNNGEAGTGVTGGTAGLDVDRGLGVNAGWIWDEAAAWWTPAGFNDALHAGTLTLEPGATPALTFTGDPTTGIYSNAAGTMALATGANVWTIDATGNLIPTGGGTQNVGNIINHSASIYSGRFFADPTGGSPQITYFGDDDTGISHPLANTIGVVTGTNEVLRFQSDGLLVADFGLVIPGGYETLVAAGGNNAIPNKKWVLDTVGSPATVRIVAPGVNAVSSSVGRVLVDATAGPITLRLHAASLTRADDLTIKRIDATANVVTIDLAVGTDTLEGVVAGTLLLPVQYQTYTLSNEAPVNAWWIF